MSTAELPARSGWRIAIDDRLAAVPVPIYGCSLALLGLALVLPLTWPTLWSCRPIVTATAEVSGAVTHLRTNPYAYSLW